MGLKLSTLLSDVFEKLSGKKARIVLIGLDAAGKTTLVQRMQTGETTPTIPTIGFHVESVKVGGVELECWDLGGQDLVRRLWSRYIEGAEGVVFVVDSSDDSRVAEAKTELFKMMNEPQLKSVPLLVLANKQDLPTAASASVLAESLGLSDLSQDHYIQPAVAVTGEGVKPGFEWLCDAMRS